MQALVDPWQSRIWLGRLVNPLFRAGHPSIHPSISHQSSAINFLLFFVLTSPTQACPAYPHSTLLGLPASRSCIDVSRCPSIQSVRRKLLFHFDLTHSQSRMRICSYVRDLISPTVEY